MRSIFVSYRRADAPDATGRITDRLTEAFGAEAVFVDLYDIPLGRDFRTEIAATLERCDVVLAVVGPDWMGRDGDGRSRIEDPRDYVRLEIEAALNRRIPVIPVLVQQATLPTPEQLPETLREFAFRNAARIRPDPDFHQDIERLILGLRGEKLQEYVGSGAAAKRTLANRRAKVLVGLLLASEVSQVAVFFLTEADGPRQAAVIATNVAGAALLFGGGALGAARTLVAVAAIAAPWIFRLVAEPLIAAVTSALLVVALAVWLLATAPPR